MNWFISFTLYSIAGKKNISENHKNKITSYDTAQKFIRIVYLAIIAQKLYIYNGRYYEYCQKENAMQMIADKCREDYAEVGDPRFLKAVYDAIMAESSLVKNPEEINRRFCSFQNGILDIYTGTLYPHSPQYFLTYGIQCDYENGNCPNFDRFIYTAMGGVNEQVKCIYQLIGYILLHDVSLKVLFVLQGCPNSGKSVFTELLRSFFNKEAVASLDVHELNNRFSPAYLEGKAFCLSPDLPSGALDSVAVSKLKQLTGSDYVSSDVKYGNRVAFINDARFVLSTNHLLVTKKYDEAFMERIVAIPFCYAIPKEKQDHNLLKKLKAERSKIAFKAVQEYYELVRNNYEFASNYQLNSAPVLYSQDSINMADLDVAIYKFAMNYFEADENSIVFMGDALEAFIVQYGITVTINAFSPRFASTVQQLFSAEKYRDRKDKGGNPRSALIGIRFKER